MKSWKIGAVAGLIAGLAMGLVIVLITLPIAFKFGLYYWGLPHPPETPFNKIATNEIISNLILGVIFGSIYSKVYPVIPGKGIWKGLPFGLFGYLAHNVYFAIIFLPYLYLDLVARVIFVGLIDWIVFGFILGISYEFLHNRYYVEKKEPRIIEYNMKEGIIPGAIAGLVGGIGSFIVTFPIVYFGLWPGIMPEIIDFIFAISQLGTQILIHLIPGLYLGAIYPKVYNLVPRKGIAKGLIYGLIASYLFSELRYIIQGIGFGILIFQGFFIWAFDFFGIGLASAIFFGLAIGYLYKPSK